MTIPLPEDHLEEVKFLEDKIPKLRSNLQDASTAATKLELALESYRLKKGDFDVSKISEQFVKVYGESKISEEIESIINGLDRIGLLKKETNEKKKSVSSPVKNDEKPIGTAQASTSEDFKSPSTPPILPASNDDEEDALDVSKTSSGDTTIDNSIATPTYVAAETTQDSNVRVEDSDTSERLDPSSSSGQVSIDTYGSSKTE